MSILNTENNNSSISIRSRLNTEAMDSCTKHHDHHDYKNYYHNHNQHDSPLKSHSHSKIRTIVNNLYGSYEQDHVTLIL